MNLNGSRLRVCMAIFVTMAILLQSSRGQKQENINNINSINNNDKNHLKNNEYKSLLDHQVGFNGDLYDAFKDHLVKFYKILSLDDDKSSSDTHTESDDTDFSIRNCLYDEIKKRLDKYSTEVTLNPAFWLPKLDAAIREYEEKRSALRDLSARSSNMPDIRRFDRAGTTKKPAAKPPLPKKPSMPSKPPSPPKPSQPPKLPKAPAESAKGTAPVPGPEETLPAIDRNQALGEEKSLSIKDRLYEEYRKQLDKINNALFRRENWKKRKTRSLVHVVDENFFNALKSQNEKRFPVSHKPKMPQRKLNGTRKSNFDDDDRDYEDYMDYMDQDAYKVQQKAKDIDRMYRKNHRHYHKQLANIYRRNAEMDYTNYNDDSDDLDDSSHDEDDFASVAATDIAYPTVLTKALETAMSPSAANIKPGNLLAAVAQKMNTSTLELAKKLTSVTDLNSPSIKSDPKLSDMLQKYIASTVKLPSMDAAAKPRDVTTPSGDCVEPATPAPAPAPAPVPAPVTVTAAPAMPAATPMPAPPATTAPPRAAPTCDAGSVDYESSSNISVILDKVLSKLERMQEQNCNDEEELEKDEQPEGAPCDIVGSWTSYVLGLRFDIALGKSMERTLSAAESANKLLTIDAQESVPPRRHDLIDPDWKFMGSAIKQLGGPFYIYSQKRSENLIATFAGFCRTCGEMDTIFGAWTFLFPSKDCQDISTSIEHKRDILRRVKMDIKRKERFKELLFEKNANKNQCRARKSRF